MTKYRIIEQSYDGHITYFVQYKSFLFTRWKYVKNFMSFSKKYRREFEAEELARFYIEDELAVYPPPVIINKIIPYP
jgi:hypothetical protein